MEQPKMESFGNMERGNDRNANPASTAKVNIEWVSQNRLRIIMAKVKQ